jgi:hypothetical protein
MEADFEKCPMGRFLISYLQELPWYAAGAKRGCATMEVGIVFACTTSPSSFMLVGLRGASLEGLVAETGGIDLTDVSGLSSLLIAGIGMMEYNTMCGLCRRTLSWRRFCRGAVEMSVCVSMTHR